MSSSASARAASAPSDALQRVAALPGRQFRTMLRLLSKGLHFEQAHVLLRARATTGAELLADDVNTVLSSILFTDAQRFALQFLAHHKRAGRLAAAVDDAAVAADAARALAAWDVGDYGDLDAARYQRSPEIHVDKAAAKAAHAGKRPRGEAGGDGGDGGGEGGGQGGVGAAVRADAPDADASGTDGADGGGGGGGGGCGALQSASESEAFKRLAGRILRDFGAHEDAPRGVAWRQRRFERARTLFAALAARELVAAGPNARSFVLMLHGAEAAGRVDEGRRVYARMVGADDAGTGTGTGTGGGGGGGGAVSGSIVNGGATAGGAVGGEGAESSIRNDAPRAVCAPANLYTVAQPALLRRLAAAGILPADVAAGALVAAPDTPKWFFLKAAYEATKGDQFGSKHGVVLTKGGRYLTHGHNHRFGVPGDKHLRVMHSEVHALVRLASEADALGAEAWIVELDGHGVGYEEAVACVMCNKALCKFGLATQHFSAGNGVRSQTSAHRPALVCESYELAKKRTYPPGTLDPDVGDEAGFDFEKDGADPGRGAPRKA
jgi:hypothetical protein